MEITISIQFLQPLISSFLYFIPYRLKDRPTLADNTRILQDKWFRRSRSKVYLYLVPLISLYYFIPAIQFAFQAKENEEISGSKDLCYHNYRCQRPWWIFSDFNHVISNMSYWIFGIGVYTLQTDQSSMFQSLQSLYTSEEKFNLLNGVHT